MLYLILLALIVGGVYSADITEGVALVRPNDLAAHPNLGGYVTFKQVSATSLAGGVTVDVSQLTGVPAGRHGFHIHQFGDSSSSEKVGGHFVPLCSMRRALDDTPITGGEILTCGDAALNRDCKCDEIHGFPPSAKRMPGDLGNLDCTADGCLLCFTGDTRQSGCAAVKTLEQEKMSLSDVLRSVVGRSIAIHKRPDTTPNITQFGLGDAGPAIAFGTIGITAPAAALPPATATSTSGDTNVAAPPGKPKAEKTICIFRKNVGTASDGGVNQDIEGRAIVSIDLSKKLAGATDYCNMRVEMYGVEQGVKSFHFHDHGDLRYGLTSNAELKTTLIGPIHNSDKLEVKTWTVPAVAPGAKQVYATSCTLGDVAELVGRSLTVHAGPDKSSPTVAMAVCGLANPSSCFEDSLKSSLKCGSAQPQTNTPVAPPGTTKASVGGRTSAVAAVLGIWGVAVIAACL